MTDKSDLSPEEKLLKVIQEGDEKGEAAGEPDAELRTEHAQGVVTAAGESARAKLKLADRPQSVPEAPLAADVEASSDVQLMDAVEDLPEPVMAIVSPGKKVAGGGFVISTVNKILVAVIVLMLGLTVYEVLARVTMRPVSAAPETGQVAGGAEGTGDAGTLPGGAGSEWDIEKTLAAYRTRPILRTQEEAGGEIVERTVKKIEPDWMQVARETLNLIGLSEAAGDGGAVEAIIVDRSADKMHFLSVGGKLLVGGSKEMTVLSISAEGVELSDGKDQITVK